MNIIKTKSFELAAYAKGDPDSRKLALVLPGRLDTKDYAHMQSHVNFLAKEGFYAISFDPPGSWESPGSLEDYSTTSYLEAVNELIGLHNKPTLLLGHSRGGAVSMLASSNQMVEALVLVMANYGKTTEPAPSEIKDGYAVSLRDLPPGTLHTAEQKKFLLPLKYFDDSKQYHPYQKLKEFEGPKLLICATNDQFIPPETVREFYDELSPPKEFLGLETEHDYRLHEDMIKRVNYAIKEFLVKYPAGNT